VSNAAARVLATWAERGEDFADEFFVGEWAIDFGGVEERDALLGDW
jgi:hypothetical protein